MHVNRIINFTIEDVTSLPFHVQQHHNKVNGHTNGLVMHDGVESLLQGNYKITY